MQELLILKETNRMLESSVQNLQDTLYARYTMCLLKEVYHKGILPNFRAAYDRKNIEYDTLQSREKQLSQEMEQAESELYNTSSSLEQASEYISK